MSAGRRSYGQVCGLAAALDLIGDRWTLLVVRELARGPKRFRDLLEGLEGIGPNLLSARLKRLEAGGVVERMVLGAPAAVGAYALTPRGRDLEPMLEALALWGFELLRPEEPGMRTRAAWAAMSMRAAMDHAGSQPPVGLYAFTIGDESFWLRIAGDTSELRDGPAPFEPDVHVRGDLDGFFALATGGISPHDGGVEVDGDRGRLDSLLETFRLPAVGA